MDSLWQDVRFGIRTLAKHRQFTFVAVLALALGIGATTAVFSVFNAVLLRPLPYDDPSRLVAIGGLYKSSTATRTTAVVPLADIAQWRTRAEAFSSMGGFAYTQLPMRVGNQSFSPVTALMDPEFLPTLGNALAMGSFFDPMAVPRGDMTAIVSHALWIDAFNADPHVLGRSIVIDGDPYVVRGVLAADFQFPRSDASYYTKPVALLIPSSSFVNFPAQSRQWFGIARLKPEVTIQRAERELQSIAEGLSSPKQDEAIWSVQLASLDAETTKNAKRPLMVVLAIAIVLLLIAATNLMNLFFSRGVGRLREMSIRRAVGGSTVRLIRQLVVESLLLAVVGGSVGVVLAAFAIDALVASSPVHLPITSGITIDLSVLGFTAAVCVSAALAAGFFPALHVSVKSDEAVRSPGMRATLGRRFSRLQQGLCVTQIALGVVLLAAAGLLAHSLWRLNSVNPGFESDRVLGFNLSVPNDQTMEDRTRFYANALEEIRSIPGVERAGLISFLPPETRAGVFMGLAIDGVPPAERGAPPRVINTLISSVGYFATMGTPVVRGRDFAETDDRSRAPVSMVNEAFVRRYMPGADAIGRRIGTGFDGMKPVREIIGVVRDAHDRGLAAEPYPTVYIPFRQFALPYGSIALRTATALETVIPVIRDRLNRLNPAVPLTDFETIDSRIHASLREPRFYTLMAATCAAMAVLFVTFGLYGLISYSVSRRTPELGIRMAVGAQPGTILGMVLLQALRMSTVGVAVGIGLAVVASRAMGSLLFQVRPIDPFTLAAAAVVVVCVTVVASYAPARRASRVNPLTALRYE
jgi:putative ABC transport system permease protein